MSRFKHIVLVASLITLSAISLLGGSAPASAESVTRSYGTDTTLQRGMIVRITANDKNKVVALTDDEASKMEGVVVAANDAPVTLSSTDTSKQQVFVANSGEYNVLVSNQNGAIKNNDYLTISSLDGVAMRADNRQSIVVGKALAAFDGTTNVSSITNVKDSAGKTVSVAITLLPVDINVAHNPLEKRKDSQVPGVSFLQSGASSIVNKSVDPARLYISLVVLLAVVGVTGSILYSGVRNSIISVGRNPLARKSIMRGLLQVIILSIIIFVIGLLGVYLILKL